MKFDPFTDRAFYKNFCVLGVFLGTAFAAERAIDLPLSTTHLQSRDGYIRGRVESLDGSPIAGAKAMAIRTDQKGELQSTLTSDRGNFTFDVPFGDYIVWSSKEADGYPDCNLAIFKCNSPHVQVGQEPSEVVVRTHKVARIRGHVTDRSDGAELKNSSLLIRRADDFYPNISLAVDSSFSVLVPSDTDLVVSVTLIKFRLWEFRDSSTHFATLTLREGQEAMLDIQMDRLEP